MELKPVVFKIGEEEYGVDIKEIRGIENVIPIVPIHNINENIKGVINLRGDVIPVYSLRRKFGIPDIPYTDSTKFVIAKSGADIRIALEVDMVEDIKNVDETNVFDIPDIIVTKKTEYYKKLINVNGKIIVILDVSKLMDEEEVEELQKAIENI